MVKIDIGNFSNQTTPYTLPAQTDGVHTITVRAYDKAGNYIDETVDIYIDTSDPDAISLTANPSNWNQNTQPVITFFASDGLSGIDNYFVKIDMGSYSEQVSPYTLPIQNVGVHTVFVRGYDRAGNYVETSVFVYIDTTSPNIFTPGVDTDGWGANTQPVLAFSTTDDVSGIDHYEVMIDAGAFTEQVSPFTLPELCDGVHNITVRAIDLAGNYRDGKLKVYIDTKTPLPFSPTVNPDGWTNDRIVLLFSTTDATSGVEHYEVKIDNGIFSTETSPWTPGYLDDGVHTITVRSFDRAGNYMDGLVSVYIDIGRPLAFTPIADFSNWSTNTRPTISFFTTDPLSGIDHYEVKIDNDDFFNRSSPYKLPALDDGVRTITVRAFDRAGNYMDGIVNVYIDTTDPIIEIINPVEDSWHAENNLKATWKCVEIDSGVQNVMIQLDDELVIDKGTNLEHLFSQLTEGIHTLTVSVLDWALNNNSAKATFYVDCSAPLISIITPKADQYITSSDVTVYWTSFDAGSGIKHFEIKLDDGNYKNMDTSTSYTLSDMVDGMHEVFVRAIDFTLNSNESSLVFYLDATKPTLANLKPQQDTTVTTSTAQVSWSGSDAGAGIGYYTVKLDDGKYINVSTNTNYTFSGLSDGTHTLYIKAVDAVGNINEKSTTFKIDTGSGKETVMENYLGIMIIIIILFIVIIIIAFVFLSKRRKQYETSPFSTISPESFESTSNADQYPYSSTELGDDAYYKYEDMIYYSPAGRSPAATRKPELRDHPMPFNDEWLEYGQEQGDRDQKEYEIADEEELEIDWENGDDEDYDGGFEVE